MPIGPKSAGVTLSCDAQMTELLYQKQTQLEHLAAQKAAQQLTLEREIEAARQQAERVSRCDNSAHLALQSCGYAVGVAQDESVRCGDVQRYCGRRVRTDRAAAPYTADGDIVVPMEAMGEAYRRLANNDRVGGAVKAGALCAPTSFFPNCLTNLTSAS